VCKFGRDPAICLREEAMYVYIMYIHYVHRDEQITIAGEVTRRTTLMALGDPSKYRLILCTDMNTSLV